MLFFYYAYRHFPTILKRRPITTTSPASTFVGIDQSITYGSPTGTTILGATAGIVDTGTTLVLLASGTLYRVSTGDFAHMSPYRCLCDLPANHRRSTRPDHRITDHHACAVQQSRELVLQHRWREFPHLSAPYKIMLTVSQQSFEFTANAQIWPRAVSAPTSYRPVGGDPISCTAQYCHRRKR